MYIKLFYSFDDVSNAPSTLETESKKPCENQLGENAFETYASEPKPDTIKPKELCSQPPLAEPSRQEISHQPKHTTTAIKSPVKPVESENKYHQVPSKLNSPRELHEDKPTEGPQLPPSKTEKSKRYLYTGPPKISLSTWNERPKRQVSIKTDRDYVIGIRQRFQQKADVETKPTDGADNKPVSRVPIVKSVELKKPYAEQLQTASPVLALSEAIKAQAKLSNGYSYHSSTIVLTDDDENARPPAEKKEYSNNNRSSYTFSKLMNRPRKPREISTNVADPRESLLESIRSFGGRDNLRKIRA